ncbi:rho-type GTPase-activating protein 2 [Drosophila innubila]|uniref:rho-type GTPase-activating protein 2 n=1 Tax=Drosophila innubila TaxID=198719 RepID=UPI00148B5A74|nr:rho-type GTPase-activating protein 2 [Drosophila innubila]
MDIKNDNVASACGTGQLVNTLRRPVTVVKKRSGPLDCMLDELDRIEESSTTTSAKNTNLQENETCASPSPNPSINRCLGLSPTASGRRRCHSKDKDKEKKRERWLLTRKTWRYMTDAGRKLFPDGMQHGAGTLDNISHIEAQFQRVCASEPRFILWRRKSSFPGATKSSSSRKRLKILSRHRNNYAVHVQQKDPEANEQMDQAIELLQSYLKIRDAYKTTFLLSAKTIRPDQTASPSSRRPINVSASVSSNPSRSENESGAYCESELLDRLKALHKSSLFGGIQLNNITPKILEDKVLLKKIYNILKKQQLHRILHSSEPTKSTNHPLGRASSFSSMFNYPSSYENTSTGFPIRKELESNIEKLNNTSNAHEVQKSRSQTTSTSTSTFTKRQRKPPESLELSHSTQSQQNYLQNNRIKQNSDLNQRQMMRDRERERQREKEKEKIKSSSGTQTKFIPLSELKAIAQQYELMIEHNLNNSEDETREDKNTSTASSRRKSSIDNEDVSQSVSDTIKRYLRMARKKSVHDADANRFKSVNYDRNLRNIKAKGEINPPGMDEGNNKAVQTLDAWALVALDFIRGNMNSKNLQNAHIAWQKDLDERIRKKLEYDLKFNSSNSKTKSICISAPTSPTNTIQNHSLKEKTGRTASALLSSSSHFISNFWHANNTESSSFQNSKNGNVNETYLNSKNDTTMQKSKSLSNVGQFVSRKIWGSRSKCQNRQNDSQHYESHPQKWAPSENCTWISEQGQVLQLTDTSLERLSDTEAELLMHIAIEKIKELNIGMNIDLELKSQKRKVISKKRALTTSFFDIGRKDEHNRRDILFGTSLEYCLTRDRKPETVVDPGSKHSLTSVFRGSNCNNNSNRVGKLNNNVRSCESLPTKSLDYVGRGPSERVSSADSFTNLQKSSSISMQMSQSQFDVRSIDMDLNRLTFDESMQNFKLNVPMFIINCIEYLEEHGLQKVGIFRVSTSRKRVKQLRDDFDKEWNMCIPPNTCPHDVATLLKEYLRDLPEPLLCKKLYTTFLETQRIRNRRLQLEAISHLIKLLPIAHRDTLHVLLRFLGNVAAHCDDICSSDGIVQMNGNKMDSHNLSTVFAPNILRNSSPNTAEYKEQGNMGDAINVIRIMIDHYEELFKVPGEMIDVLYSHMLDTCPDKLHALISNKIQQLPNTQIENFKSKSDNENDSQVYLKEAAYDSTLICDGRRQSTPVLLDKLNVFSASLQITMPDESALQASHSENKMISSSIIEPKLPASISNIGGATLSAKTAEFEKSANKNSTYHESHTHTAKTKQLYKRQQLISSSKR